MENDGVIKLKPISDLEFSLKIKKEKHCNHSHIEVDEDEREIRCQKCNSVIDPFDFLLTSAYEERNHFTNIIYLKSEVELYYKAIERAKKDLVNLKNQEKRWKEKNQNH